MLKIQQLQKGKVVYEDTIENYNYSIPSFINNGAVKITIEYPISTIVITPILDLVEIQGER